MNSFVPIISLFFIAFGLSLGLPSVQAQPYPSHPIQLVIPGAPGDAVDIAARSVAEELSQILNSSFRIWAAHSHLLWKE